MNLFRWLNCLFKLFQMMVKDSQITDLFIVLDKKVKCYGYVRVGSLHLLAKPANISTPEV